GHPVPLQRAEFLGGAERYRTASDDDHDRIARLVHVDPPYPSVSPDRGAEHRLRLRQSTRQPPQGAFGTLHPMTHLPNRTSGCAAFRVSESHWAAATLARTPKADRVSWLHCYRAGRSTMAAIRSQSLSPRRRRKFYASPRLILGRQRWDGQEARL